MREVLCLSASARKSRSLTRQLLDDFIENWQIHYPEDKLIQRDIGSNPPSFISEEWIAAAFAGAPLTPQQQAVLAESDRLADELIRAQVVVFAVPMYNYSMPAALKAWFDQTVRVNKTFSFDLSREGNPCAPIHTGKTGVILSASGEGGFDTALNDPNYLHLHIQKASHLLGIEQFEALSIEYQEFGDERLRNSIAAAHKAIPALVQKLKVF